MKDDTNSHIKIKKKYFVLSIILVSFVSIILVTTSLLSSSTSNNNILTVNAQQEQLPPKSPSQLQAEEKQQQRQTPKSPSQLQAEEKQQQKQDQQQQIQSSKASTSKPTDPKPPKPGKKCPGGGVIGDIKNCKACGLSCDFGETCQSGQCKCPNGGNVVYNGGSDTPNCGSCGNACSAGEECSSGSCLPVICLILGQERDPRTGECECPAGQVVGTGNDADKCVPDCTTTHGPDYINCGGNCVNKNTDHNNCGSCRNTCAIVDPGTSCVNGVCSPTVPKCASTSNPDLCFSCGAGGGQLRCASCIEIGSDCS